MTKGKRVYEVREIDGTKVVLSYDGWEHADIRRYRASYPGAGAIGFTLDQAIRDARSRWESYGRHPFGRVDAPPGWEQGDVR